MSNAINEIDNTDLVFVFGYNPADSHPIVANHVINAKRNGAKIIVCDPRKIETARIADMHIALKNGSNIALLNAMGHVIIEENLYDKAFVASRTEGFEEYRKIVEGYTPESVEDITGVSASEIRQAARMYAQAKSAAILWGMGVTQFYQGVETVRSLTSLAMLTGNLGKPHAGVNPVRGQNNVQGACDMGALPDTYPGYQYVKDPANREKFAKAWGVESLPAHTGYRISELPHRAAHGEVRAAYIMGEDPLQTDAELSAVRKAFEDLELVIVQDIFMTKTAEVADVLLPATSWGEHAGVFTCADRGFQRFGNLGILKARQSLEKAFASRGVSVLWSEFPAGPQLLHALACDEIDFGTTGEAPPVFAQANNSELVYVAWEPPAPQSVAMVVPQHSDIRTIADLRGKRIALNKGSNVHWLLLHILEEAGLGLNDVKVVYIPPKYPLTASDYLAVDAWMMWDPLLSDAEHTGELRVVASGEGRVNNHQFYLSRRDYLAQHGDIMRRLLTALRSRSDLSVQFLDPLSDSMQSASFRCTKQPTPQFAFSRDGVGLWNNIAFTLEEVEGS